MAELQTSGGTLEERFLELIAEARPGDETWTAAHDGGASADVAGMGAAAAAIAGKGVE